MTRLAIQCRHPRYAVELTSSAFSYARVWFRSLEDFKHRVDFARVIVDFMQILFDPLGHFLVADLPLMHSAEAQFDCRFCC